MKPINLFGSSQLLPFLLIGGLVACSGDNVEGISASAQALDTRVIASDAGGVLATELSCPDEADCEEYASFDDGEVPLRTAIRAALFASLPAPSAPDQLSGPSGAVREVDIAHIGGQGAPAQRRFVTAVGTGSVGQLVSWSATHPGAAATVLAKSPNLLGYDHQLHVLTPANSPKLAHEMFVSGRIVEGTLWLTTWKLAADGSFERKDTRGYGASVGAAVAHYAMGHRSISLTPSLKRWQLVTPIHSTSNRLRLITWEIDGATGSINGRFDSGNVGPVSTTGSDLSIAFAPGNGVVLPHYTVARQDDKDDLQHTMWEVPSNGKPKLLVQESSGRDIRNASPVKQGIQNVAVAPLAATGHLAATLTAAGALKVTAWDDADCADGICDWGSLQIADESTDLQPNVAGVQLNVPGIGTNKALLRDPSYDVDLFTKNPDAVQAIASTRKVMVTIVALDAVAAGQVSLDDNVVVSAAAAAVNNSGASSMGLQAGEVMTLRDLLYGNMIVSAGDATWAISEYVAGSVANMVTRMNNKANALGMTNTFHCQSGTAFSSVSYSTPRDQVKLWESAFQNPLFLEFAGKSVRAACGTLPNNQVLCHGNPPPLAKSMTQYPNLAGHKTGAGGGLCPNIPAVANLPTCSSSGCLAIQSTRLNRALIASELQPTGLTGTRWTDAGLLFDYGFQKLFAPDFRALEGGGSAEDFALSSIEDSFVVSAVVDGTSALKVCNWALDVSGQSLEQPICTELEFALPLGKSELPPTRIAVERVSTLEAEGDYIVGALGDDNQLSMRLWRVGQK